MAERFPPPKSAEVSGADGPGGLQRERNDPEGSPRVQQPCPQGDQPASAIIQPRGQADFRRAAFHRQSYAAIDLGTNNCRLLIARPSGENFVVIDAFSRVVRLGEGLAQTGRLSDEAMDRALA